MKRADGSLHRKGSGTQLAVGLGIAVVAVMLALLVLRPVEALSGTIAGRAATAEGTILGVGVSVNAITLPSDGSPVSAGVALNSTGDVVIAGSTLSVSATSDTASTSCEGVPSDGVVSAQCISQVEGLHVGVTLDPVGVASTVASIVSAEVLRAESTSTDDGSGPTSSSAGTIITGLCIYLDGSTCTNVTGSGTFNIAIAGILTGTVEVVVEESRTEHDGVDGSGLTVTMLRIDLDAIELLDGIDVMNLDLVVADSFVGGVVDDLTPTPTSTPVDDFTPTPTSTPVDDFTPTPTSTPVDDFTPTPTSTPVDDLTPTPTSTPVDGDTIPGTPPGPGAPTPAPPATGSGGSGGNNSLLMWFAITALLVSAAGGLALRVRQR